MSPAAIEDRLCASLGAIHDVHERMAVAVSRSRRRPAMEGENKTAANLVPGCVSRVWMTIAEIEGRAQIRVAADSPMVFGLVSLMAEIFDGATPGEVLRHESRLLERLELQSQISPTRLNGLRHVELAIKAWAQERAKDHAL